MYLGQVTGLLEHKLRESDCVHVGQHVGEALVVADEAAATHGPSERTRNHPAPQRPELLAEACATLLDQPDLRARIANAGHQYVQRFTWQSAADSLEAALRTA